MKPKYTDEQFKQAKAVDKLPLECENCGQTFFQKKCYVQTAIAGRNTVRYKYCGFKCLGKSQDRKLEVACDQCGKKRLKLRCQVKNTKHNFCNRSCAATYNNLNKKYGIRRSKLEIWLESEIRAKYPDLIVEFNKKEAIGSELDIYFPSLKFAVELNGIFHYEPIHGADRLDQIQNNDDRKFQACLERGIELCIIDTSYFNNFKINKAQNFLSIICNIIDKKLVNSSPNTD